MSQENNFQAIKYHDCPQCHTQATLIIDDLDDGAQLVLDSAGNRQYHCDQCPCSFSVEEQGQIVIQVESKKQEC